MIDSDQYDLKHAVEGLIAVQRRLLRDGRFVVLITILHLIVIFGAAFFLFVLSKGGLRISDVVAMQTSLLGFDIVLLLSAILALFRFDQSSKFGEIIFTEIANENEWRGEDGDRLRFQYRVVLRQFSLARELPLARGDLGVSIYLIINLFATASLWILLIITPTGLRSF